MGLFGKKKKYKPLEASTVVFTSLNGVNISDDELHYMCDGLPIMTYRDNVMAIVIHGKTPFTGKDFQLNQIRYGGDPPIKRNQKYYISANTNLDIEGQVAIRKPERVDIPIIQSDDETNSLCQFKSNEERSFSISFPITKMEYPT